MLKSDEQLVKQVVDNALGGVRVDDPNGWRALCPPPCAGHSLTDIVTNHEEEPIVVFQTRVHNPDDPTIGVIAYGRSLLAAGNEQRPLAERLVPPLARVAFTAILSPDIDVTYAQFVYNTPANTGRVRIPLENDGERLRANTSSLTPDEVGLAILYLQ